MSDKRRSKFKALDVRIEKDAIVIRAHMQCVAFATENHPKLWDGENDHGSYKVIDEKKWIKGVLSRLKREEEDGSTPVTRMLDDAIEEAVNQGEEGLEDIP